jgi:hypothetical protein
MKYDLTHIPFIVQSINKGSVLLASTKTEPCAELLKQPWDQPVFISDELYADIKQLVAQGVDGTVKHLEEVEISFDGELARKAIICTRAPILEYVVSREEKTQAEVMAEAILKSANLRESSYDKAAADEATEVAEAQREAEPDNIYAGFVDHESFYGLTLEEACKQASPEDIWEPVYLLLALAWNDACDWAKNTINNARGRIK